MYGPVGRDASPLLSGTRRSGSGEGYFVRRSATCCRHVHSADKSIEVRAMAREGAAAVNDPLLGACGLPVHCADKSIALRAVARQEAAAAKCPSGMRTGPHALCTALLGE